MRRHISYGTYSRSSNSRSLNDTSYRDIDRFTSRVMTRIPPSALPVFLRFQLYTPTTALDTYEYNHALAFRVKSHNSAVLGATLKLGPLGFRWEFMIKL